MFRKSKSDTAVTADPTSGSRGTRAGAKGRPTPSRKEAEAAAKARAKAPRSRKEQAAAARARRMDAGDRQRAALKGGDPRYLPVRDRGPVRAFIRDFVDTRFSFVELLIPLMFLTLVLGFTGSTQAAATGNAILLATVLIVAVELVLLRFRVRRELTRRFPDEPTRGTTYYAVMRSMQMRFMRLPKSRVKIGEKLPETYR